MIIAIYLFTGFFLEATTFWLVGSVLITDIYVYITLKFVYFKFNRNRHMILHIPIFVLGWVGPIISITTNGYQIADFPPTHCVSKSEVLFYAVILPISAMSITGITLKLLTFHIILDSNILQKVRIQGTTVWLV